LHVSGKTAAKYIATWVLDQDKDSTGKSEEIAIALGRLPFSSKPAPAEFSNASDLTFDLANDLMNCTLWDAETMPCPLKKDIPPLNRLPDSIPFGKAQKADVQLPIDFKGGTDGYIDDGTNVMLDSSTNQKMVARAEQCICMALHLQFRPNAGKLESIQ